MLFVPEGADGGLEVLLAVLLLPPAILASFPSKSANLSFPECCQFSCSSVGMQCNHNGQTGKPPSRLAPHQHPAAACTLPASSFLQFSWNSRLFRITILPDGQPARLSSSSGLFFSTGLLACLLPGTIAHPGTGGSGISAINHANTSPRTNKNKQKDISTL